MTRALFGLPTAAVTTARAAVGRGLLVLLAMGGPAFAQAGRDLSPPADLTSPPADATKTSSGLITKQLSPGTSAEKPAATDIVTVDYTGWASDGRMFDSSVARG